MKIVYIHGINQSIGPRKLKFLLDQALLEQESTDSQLCYWGDVLHPTKESILPAGEVIIETFLSDVYKYFRDKDVQKAVDKRLTDILDDINEPFIIVSHSLGTVIAWKVLSTYHRKIEVPTFITLGSPLGMEVLKDELKKSMGIKKFYKPPCVTRWYNFADPLDVVAADKTISDEYTGRLIKDKLVFNPDTFKLGEYGSHSFTGYLSTNEVRREVTNSILMNSNPITKMLYKFG